MARDKWGFYGAAIFIALIVTLLKQKLIIEGLVANSDGTYCRDGLIYATSTPGGEATYSKNMCISYTSPTSYSSEDSIKFIGCSGSSSTQPSTLPGCVWGGTNDSIYTVITTSPPPCPKGSYSFAYDSTRCVTLSLENPLINSSPATTSNTTAPTTTTTATSTTTATATAATATNKKEWYEEPVNIGIMAVSGFVILMVLLTR